MNLALAGTLFLRCILLLVLGLQHAGNVAHKYTTVQ